MAVYDARTHAPTKVQLVAASPQDAASAAARAGWVVDASGGDAKVLDETTPAGMEGKALAETAGLLAALSVVIPFLAVVAIVTGGVAKERSRGVYGGGAQAASVFVLLAWLLVIAAIFAQR